MNAPVKKKRNRRTLKRRIRRLIYLSSLLNILFFGCLLFLFPGLFMKPLSAIASHLVGYTIANEISNHVDFSKERSEEDLKLEVKKIVEAPNYLQSLFMTKNSPSDDFVINKNTSILDLINVKVVIGNRTVYSNEDRESTLLPAVSDQKPWVQPILKKLIFPTHNPILNEKDEPIGSVTSSVVPEVGMVFLFSILCALLVLIGFAMIVTSIFSRFLTIPIIAPINTLEKTIKKIADGDIIQNVDTQIQLKRPLKEMESLAESTNRIMQKMQTYNTQLQSQSAFLQDQKDELEMQNDELVKSKEQIQQAKELLAQKEQSQRNLLNHVNQGYLTFGEDLLIDQEYSLECTHIFNRKIEYHSFPSLLANGDIELQSFLESLLTKIFSEKDLGKREIYLPLLLSEVNILNKHLEIEYKMITDPQNQHLEKFMVMVTDVSEKKYLQSQMEVERNTLKMVVKVAIHRNDFLETLQDYKHFCDISIPTLLSEKRSLQDIALDIYRAVHTFKGSFSQFEMVHTVLNIHEGETRLSEFLKEIENHSLHDLIDLLNKLSISSFILEDLQLLLETLGHTFFEQEDTISINESKLLQIENKMLAILSPYELNILLPEIRQLRYKPFHSLFTTYPDYVKQLAERTEKSVYPLVIKGGDFLVDQDYFLPVSKALIHVFRNSLDHGIETAEERLEAGKSEFGTISCVIHQNMDKSIEITIEDDGRGIPTEVLKDQLQSKGILTEEEAASLSNHEIIQYIFLEHLSTNQDVTDLSGRGVGLSAVKREIEKLRGHYEVFSEPGLFTRFQFIIPYEEKICCPTIQLETVLEPIYHEAVSYLNSELNLAFPTTHSIKTYQSEKLPLQNVSSFIMFKGTLTGMFVVSVDKQLSKAILSKMLLGEVPSDEEATYIEESLAEFTNIILGHSLKHFPNMENNLMIESPITLFTQEASVKYSESAIWSCDLENEQGKITLSLIKMNKSEELE
ncbi:ATP-binding protein [Bacillus sp. CGMCC 1.16607]|uniref:ATP-binding protein n=1 Tax=Bacillus sp. CGMCC 1.16607 TaxID=3351842 RepID=UPI00364269D5